MVHELKILPEFFKAVKKGKKTFEIRTNDRPFKVNDHIVLKEWTGNDYTGEQVKVRIKYILDDENYLLKNTVAMSIEILDENIYPSATTEINIDYFRELKAKADKWDEKETPKEVIDEDGITFSCPSCYADNSKWIDWSMLQRQPKRAKVCQECGQKLDWQNDDNKR